MINILKQWILHILQTSGDIPDCQNIIYQECSPTGTAESPQKHNINLVQGTLNAADGNFGLDAVIYNIYDKSFRYASIYAELLCVFVLSTTIAVGFRLDHRLVWLGF